MASSEARDVLHWAVHPKLYCHNCMVIEIASKVGELFYILNFVVINNLR